jgi:hypothetical protein
MRGGAVMDDLKLDYPKQFYKGSYTADAIQGESRVALNEKQEKALRKLGFVDGHEFFYKPPEPNEDES